MQLSIKHCTIKQASVPTEKRAAPVHIHVPTPPILQEGLSLQLIMLFSSYGSVRIQILLRTV